MSTFNSTTIRPNHQEPEYPLSLWMSSYLKNSKRILSVLICDAETAGYRKEKTTSFISETSWIEIKDFRGTAFALISDNQFEKTKSTKEVLNTTKIHNSSKEKTISIPIINSTIDTSNINKNKTGWVYLLKNDEFGILKIGYSFSIHHRMKTHECNGFRSIEILKINDLRAYVLEQFLLSFIRCNWVPFGKDVFSHEFDGWSECWLEKHYPVYSFDQLRACIVDFAVNCLPNGFEEVGQ